MLNAIGSSALMVALAISVLGLVTAAVGGRRRDAVWIRGRVRGRVREFRAPDHRTRPRW